MKEGFYSLLNQVLWLGKPETDVTWEPAEAIDPNLIAEFESDTQGQPYAGTTSCYGQVSTTLMVHKKRLGPPSRKEMRMERPCTHGNAGLVYTCMYICYYWCL